MLWGEAITPIARPVFKKIWETGERIIGLANYQSQVSRAGAQYHKKYWERHGQVKIFPRLMQEKVSLESIYTAVQFLKEWDIRRLGSDKGLEELYRQGNNHRGFASNAERLDGIEVAKQEQYLMVLGGPGVGKSTFLRKLGLEAFQTNGRNFQRSRIPVLIELKGFQSQEVDLKAAITKEFKISNYPDSSDFTDYLLDEGLLLILLDGLDEVPTQNLNPVIEHIENFVDQYSKNWFVASCRTAAYYSSFRRFRDVAMAEFNDCQIEVFIKRWFQSELDQKVGTAQALWKLLQQPKHKATKELAQTPLLLTFLCLNYDSSQTLPNNRSDLYRAALNIILQEWAAEKRLTRDPIYEGLHPRLEEVLLANIAHRGFEQDRLLISEQEITNQITAFLADTLDAPQSLNGQAVLQAIEVQQGILVQRAPNRYSFSHLTLQEYLTAKYIVGKRQVEKMVHQHLNDDRWREVFLLIAGLMEFDVLDLLLAMEQKAQIYLNTSKLKALVKWANQSTEESQGNYKPAAKRSIALALTSDRDSDIARDIARDIAHAKNLVSDLDNAITSAIDLARDSARYLDLASNFANYSELTSDIDSYLARNFDSNYQFAAANDLDFAIDHANDSTNDLVNQLDLANDIANDLSNISALASNSVIAIDLDHALALAGEGANDLASSIASTNARASDITIDLANDIAHACDIASSIASDLARASSIASSIASDLARTSSIASDIARTIGNDLVHTSNTARTNVRTINLLDLDLNRATQYEKLNIFSNVNFKALIDNLNSLKKMVPGYDQPRDVRLAFIEQLEKTWLYAFGLPLETRRLSSNELQSLIHYLKAQQLMLDCKKAAVRVSRETWQKLEDRMITVITTTTGSTSSKY